MQIKFKVRWKELIILFLCCICTELFAQSTQFIQAEDYVILQNGRRFDGTILREIGKRDFEKIEFLRRGETVTYTPDDIQSFGFGTGEYFQSLVLVGVEGTQFIQILYRGEVNLGRVKEYFFAGPEDAMKVLEEKSNYQAKETSPNPDYRALLRTLMTGDCEGKISSLIQRTKLIEEDLIWLFNRYYSCKGGDFTFYGEFKSLYELSPIVGLTVYQTGIKADKVTGDRKDLISSSPVIQGFFGFSLHSIRKFPRLAIDGALAIEASSFTWNSQNVTSVMKYTATEEMGLWLASLPLTVNYTLIKTRNKGFFVGFGPGFGLSFSNSDFAIQDSRVNNSNEVRLDEGSFTSIRNGAFFFHAQAGLQVKLKSQKEISLAARFKQIGNYYSVVVGNNTASYSRVDIGLSLGLLF